VRTSEVEATLASLNIVSRSDVSKQIIEKYANVCSDTFFSLDKVTKTCNNAFNQNQLLEFSITLNYCVEKSIQLLKLCDIYTNSIS